MPILQALTPEPSPSPALPPEALLQQFGIQWSQGEWEECISTLEQLQAVAPDLLDYKDKLYVTYYNAAKASLAKGNAGDAAERFGRAQELDPTRGEARWALLALTPGPARTPLP